MNASTRPRVTIVIVNWNSGPHLNRCLESVRAQTCKDWECLLIDNASTDGSLAQARTEGIRILANDANCGFSVAVNQGIENSRGEFIVLLNPDVFLEPDYLQELLNAALQHPEEGSWGGKLLRWEDGATDILDTTGLILLKSKRRPWDRGSGEVDRGQYDARTSVLGINGAAVLYRRAMLDDIQLNGEIFDTGFFIYFEDVDLALRAQLRGWSSRFVPRARAYHVRGGSGGESSPKVQTHSAKNRYLVYFKNEPGGLVRHFLPQIVAVETLRLLRYALSDRNALKGFFQFLRLIPRYWRKRRKIQSRRTIPSRALLLWYE